MVIIGCGGLGQFGVQYARLLTPSVNVVAVDVDVVAVDVDDANLSIVKELGADTIVNSKTEDAVEKVEGLRDNEGAQGVVDFVGVDVMLTQAYSMGGRQSKLVIIGTCWCTLKFTAGLVNELELTTSNWGSISELSEVLFLAKMRKVQTKVKKIRFDE